LNVADFVFRRRNGFTQHISQRIAAIGARRFLEIVSRKLGSFPQEMRGIGLLHRIAEAQRDFVKPGPVAFGTVDKYGRTQPRRQGRRR